MKQLYTAAALLLLFTACNSANPNKGAMNTEKVINEITGRYAFTWYNMGINPFK